MTDGQDCAKIRTEFVETLGGEFMHTHRTAVAAGHICLDLTPVFRAGRGTQMEKILEPGKLIDVGAADIHTGGAVANTGLAMRKLGIDTKLMGKIGDDALGKTILSILESHHAAEGMIVDSSATTSYSIVLAIPGIDRMFLHHPGANHTFSYDDLDFAEIAKADLFHFGYPPIMRQMYLNEGAELIRIFQKVHEMGLLTSLDLAAIDPSSEAAQQDWEKILRQVLPYVDFFVPSIEELCMMLLPNTYEEWLRRADGKDITSVLTMDDILPLAEKLREMGARNFLIKCGAPGLYFDMADAKVQKELEAKSGLVFQDWADKKGFEKSYEPDQVLSGTGAGDTTIAAFLSALLQEYDLETCLHLASATGASCVAAYDALSGIRSFAEQLEQINNGWKKQDLLKTEAERC